MTDEELKNSIATYQPSQQTLAAMSQIRLCATVGPTAAGKSTLMRYLAEHDPGFHFVVGETSRAPRDNEEDGIDLYFRDRDEIIEDLQAGALSQVVLGLNGYLYCTRVSNFMVDKTNLFPLIPRGVAQFRALPLKSFAAAFIVPASFEVWQQWVKKQAAISHWSDAQLRGRLQEGIGSHEFALNDPQIHFVLNDDVASAARRLAQVAAGRVPADETAARTQAERNYQKLKGIID